MDNLTFTVYHQDSSKVIASGLNEVGMVDLIQKMISEGLIKNISLTDYMHNPYKAIDMIKLLKDIESQGVFEFSHTWHAR